MASVILYGLFQSSNNKSLNDFFLAGNNVSWVTAMFSIVATETSVLTFISVPGIAYRGDWTFLQLAMGYIFGRILVSIFLLPVFFKYGVTSIYEILKKKFSVYIQKLASLTFIITRLLADGVRFLATAIIIQSITGWSINESIFLIGIVTLIYTVSGGLKAVIHIDAFQFIIYLISALICIFFLYRSIDYSLYESIVYLNDLDKFKTFDFTGKFFSKPFMFLSAFIGGTMLSLASHGADYMMVQRVLATKNISSAKKAMIGSGVFVLFQFLLFLFIGSLIYIVSGCLMLEKDREITYIIHNILPIGFKGIVIAGILSAAMSTLSSSINSLSSSTIKDWFPKIQSIKVSRLIAIIWTIILVVVAITFNQEDNALVIIGLKIASFTYGVLLSFFILSQFKIKYSTTSILFGYIYGILVVFIFMKFNISWTFYILGSVIINLLLVFLIERTSNYLLIKDIAIIGAIFLFFSLFIYKEEDEFIYSNIIDIEIKESCANERVWTGADIFKLHESSFDDLKNVALVINHTSDIVSIDEKSKTIITDFTNIKTKIIFTPEHGLKNNYQAGDNISNNNSYNIPIISLYGKKIKPSKENLEGIDAVIFDIQDIGSRYYTYISTMTYMMNVCAENNIKFYVLDKPNPISGVINGPILEGQFSSFVGLHEIPIRHGMTIGEIAFMINEKGWLSNGLKVDLNIVKMQGWHRTMYFEDTNLNFIPPSPNIPDVDTAILYSGLCLIEGTNLSEGRGTNFPFKQIGAPWLNVDSLLLLLKSNNFHGVTFKKTLFTPKSIQGKSSSPKYQDLQCQGIMFEINDRNIIRPIEITLYLLDAIHKLHEDKFEFISDNFIDKLYGSDKLRKTILNNNALNDLMNSWEFKLSKTYLLY